MLLTVTGRKSGQPRTVPLIYLKDGDRLVIAAAYAGSDVDPVWWRNLRENRKPLRGCGIGRSRCVRRWPARPSALSCGGDWWRCIRTSPSTSSGPIARSRSWC